MGQMCFSSVFQSQPFLQGLQLSLVFNSFSTINCKFALCLAHVFILKIMSLCLFPSSLVSIFCGSLYPPEVCRIKCKIILMNCKVGQRTSVAQITVGSFLGRAWLCFSDLNTHENLSGGKEDTCNWLWAVLSRIKRH